MFYVHSKVEHHQWHSTSTYRHLCGYAVDSSNIPKSPSFLDYLSINQPEKGHKMDKGTLKSFRRSSFSIQNGEGKDFCFC